MGDWAAPEKAGAQSRAEAPAGQDLQAISKAAVKNNG